MFETSTLRPGLLVSLKTSVNGNVQYAKRTIEEDHVTATGSKLAVWETERKITDPLEHEKAQRARSEARHAIVAVCSTTAFGLLCPEDKADKLDEAIAKAREIVDAFNRTATVSRLGVYVICGRVAQDDVEAMRAINSEVRDLMDSMSEGIKNLDVKAVRAAANKARTIGQMLSTEASDKIKVAIEQARQTASKYAKAGEGASQEVDLLAIKRIEQQRFAFLDLGDHDEVAVPVGTGRAVDFAPDEEQSGEEQPENVYGPGDPYYAFNT